ncbi:MAG: CDP-alcohol phosphatidyltransferase family protein [Chloroflexi bacterium]|nr:CDP-alcohol phosphatidyltransferase family protein [Chloroflexota bacterium]
MRGTGTLGRALDWVRDPVVAALAAVGVRPNSVTLLGLAITGVAGYAAAQAAPPLAGLLFLAGSLLDGLDGALARRTGAVSRFGAFLDSVADRIGEGLLLFGVLVLFLRRDNDLGASMTFLALLLSLLVSYARARAEGLGLRGTGGLAPRPVRIAILIVGLLASGLLTWSLALVALLSGASVLQRGLGVWRQTRASRGPQ